MWARGRAASALLNLCQQAREALSTPSTSAATQYIARIGTQTRRFAQPAFAESLNQYFPEQRYEPDYRPEHGNLPPGSRHEKSAATNRRTGVIAVKAGMTQDWDQWGQRIPLTVLWIDECEVVQVKKDEHAGHFALQLGCGAKREKQVHPRQVGHCAAAKVPLKRKLAEFIVSEDGLLPPRTEINASHFTPGQYVDIQGTTIGKGFQGVMKKWGFAGQPASHGNSKAHRKAGATGACQDPGKIWKGKKMAGRMGNQTRTVLSAWVYKVDPIRNLLYVRGQVPGHKGNFVLVKDAVMKTYAQQPERAFPTFLKELPQEVLVAPQSAHDPFEHRER